MAALTPAVVAPSTWRERAIVVVLAFALTTALTVPTVPRFLTSGRLDTGDGRFSIWNVAWVAHAIVDAPRQLFDANIFFPHSSTLTYSELNLVAGALAAPVYAATRNAIAAHNSAVVAALMISFLAMWALIRRLTGSSRAGVVAATGYTFCAYTSAHTAEIQLLMIFGFPLVMLAFHQAATRKRMSDGVLLGGALAVTALGCGYYGVFAAAVVALAGLLWAKRERAYWTALGVGIVTSVVLVAPVVVPYLRDRAAAGAVTRRSVDELRDYSADWRAYLTSGTTLDAMWGPALYRGAGTFNEVLFPGIIVSALAAVGCVDVIRRRDREETRLVLGYLCIAGLAAWASFGPSLGLYDVLRVIPGATMLRAPSRLGIVVTFALAVIAAFGYRRIERGRSVLVALVVAGLVAELWVPWPLRTMPPPPRAYEMLAMLPRGGVVEFPFAYDPKDFHNQTWAMLRSTSNWQPLVNGYSDFTPPDYYDLALPITAFPDPVSFDLLKKLDVRYVIVRVADFQGEARDRLLARFPPYDAYLHRLTADHDVWLYEIVAWPPGSHRS